MENNKVFYRALISSTSKSEAERIIGALLTEKLIAGAMITSGEAQYWWDEEIAKSNYFNISCFTQDRLVNEVIELVEKLHADEVPIIAFFKVERANPKFLTWIDENTKSLK